MFTEVKVGHTDNPVPAPRVSVVMGMYNCADTLRRAIMSILNQTYQDWELILCDDASTDNTYSVALEFARQDSRIVLLRNEHNAGCNIVLNRCIEVARGAYIAVMDGDDIALPERIEKEVAVLDAHPEYAIVGSAAIHFNEQGDFLVVNKKEMPSPMSFVRGIPHVHPSCMVRREALLAIGGYVTDKHMNRVEDYFMMVRLYASGYKGFNLQEPLLRFCDDARSYARRTWRNRLNEVHTYNRSFTLLRLPFYTRFVLLRPLLVGLLPAPMYHYLHCRKWKRTVQK